MIRYLSSTDAVAFLEIREDSLRMNPESFGGSPHEMSLDEVKKALNTDNNKNFVLGHFEGSKLDGIIGFVRKTAPKSSHYGFIWGFFVYPEARSKGVGKKLLRECISRASTLEGLKMIDISVTAEAKTALQLYKKFGFEAYGSRPLAYQVEGRFVDEILMVKKLD